MILRSLAEHLPVFLTAALGGALGSGWSRRRRERQRHMLGGDVAGAAG